MPYLMWGGARFTANVSTEQINRFVSDLPDEQRESMAEVVRLLEEQGLISIDHHDVSSIAADDHDSC